MRTKPFMLTSALASLLVMLTLGAWPSGSAASVHAQEATQPSGDAAQAALTATALVTQFKLSQVYQDSVYTFDYPAGWVANGQPGTVGLINDRALLTAAQSGLPTLTAGQIAIIIANNQGTPAPSPSDTSGGSNPASSPTPGNTPSPTSTPSPSDIVTFMGLVYSDPPLNATMGTVQPFKLGVADGAEATFSMKNEDGLVISFYSNGQPVILVAFVASGELPKDQALIEAIAATDQGVKAGAATPAPTLGSST